MTTNGNKKRSVVIMDKRTSVCLEDSFWHSLHAIVRMERTTIENFIESVKRDSDPHNLSSSLRVAILEYFQRFAVEGAGRANDNVPNGEHGMRHMRPLPETSREARDQVVAFWSGVRQHHAMAK